MGNGTGAPSSRGRRPAVFVTSRYASARAVLGGGVLRVRMMVMMTLPHTGLSTTAVSKGIETKVAAAVPEEPRCGVTHRRNSVDPVCARPHYLSLFDPEKRAAVVRGRLSRCVSLNRQQQPLNSQWWWWCLSHSMTLVLANLFCSFYDSVSRPQVSALYSHAHVCTCTMDTEVGIVPQGVV